MLLDFKLSLNSIYILKLQKYFPDKYLIYACHLQLDIIF